MILAAIVRLTSLNVFLANDETEYWEWSRAFFFALLRGDWAGTIVGPGNPSVTLFWNHALNMGVKYAWAWLNGIQATALATWPDFQPTATLDLLVERRVPIVLFNTLAVVLAYYLVHRLYGRKVAILAALLLALDPFYLADSRTSRGEGLFASFVILAILLYLAYWVFGRSRYLILSGIVSGLALLTKTPGISLVGWTMLATLAAGFWGMRQPGTSKGSQLRRMAVAWGVWALLAIATYWAVWPAMWTAPGKALSFVLSFVDNVGVGGRENYFFGQVYHDEPLPFFYLVVYVLRVTPLAWLGLLAAVAYLGRAYLRRPSVAVGEPADTRPLLTLLILCFALIYGAMMTVGTLKRDWYLIPAFPALDIVAAVGLIWLFEGVWERWGKHKLAKVPVRVAWGGGLAAALALQSLTVLPSHPYYYTYWNPAVLGNNWAPDAVRIGWDLDLSAGADYLNTKPHAESLRVGTRSTRGFEQIFKGQTLRWVPGEPWIQADYLILRTNHIQRQKIDAETLAYVSHLKVDHVVNIGGVDYLWVYVGPHAEYFAGPSILTGKATLLGYDVNNQGVAAGEALRIKLYWQNTGMAPADDLFWRLEDPGGYVWAEAVAAPLPGFEEANRTADQFVESQVVLEVPVGTPPGAYLLRGGVYSHERQETLGYFTLPSQGDRVTITRPAAAPATELPMGHNIGAKISPAVSLLGFDLAGDTLAAGGDNWLTLYWRADADVGKDYAIALRLLNSEGKETTYWLGRPAMSGYPTDKWVAGEVVRDPWRLSLTKDIPPGRYTLETEVYEADTGRSVGKATLGQVTVAAGPASE